MKQKTNSTYVGTRASGEIKNMLIALAKHYERTPADTIRYLIRKDYREVVEGSGNNHAATDGQG